MPLAPAPDLGRVRHHGGQLFLLLVAGLGASADRRRSSDPEIRARLAEADCLLVQLGVAVTPELLDAVPRLRSCAIRPPARRAAKS